MSSDESLIEHKTSGEEIFRGKLLHVMRDTVRLPDGGTTQREYIRHPGAVMMVPMFDDGGVLLERQFRYPVGRVMIEFPAGKLEPGEDPLACARRELLEETGYVAREWARAGELHPAIGFADEVIHIWFCRGLELHERKLDAGEFLEIFTASPAQLLAMCRDGQVSDAKTLAGSLWLQNVLSGAWELRWRQQSAEAVPDNPES